MTAALNLLQQWFALGRHHLYPPLLFAALLHQKLDHLQTLAVDLQLVLKDCCALLELAYFFAALIWAVANSSRGSYSPLLFRRRSHPPRRRSHPPLRL